MLLLSYDVYAQENGNLRLILTHSATAVVKVSFLAYTIYSNNFKKCYSFPFLNILFRSLFAKDVFYSVSDLDMPNVRYELEYEQQSRRDKELASKTGQVLIDWETDSDQAEAEKEADRGQQLFSTAGSSTLQPHRLHQARKNKRKDRIRQKVQFLFYNKSDVRCVSILS